MTKALTKNFISILLIRNIYPSDIPRVNSHKAGTKAEFINEKKVNLML